MSGGSSSTPTGDVEAVAEAMWRAARGPVLYAHPGSYSPDAAWSDVYEQYKGHYRLLASTAVQALGLTEERDRHEKCVCRHSGRDHWGGKCGANMVSRHTPCPCTHWQPQKRTRLVSPWGPWVAAETTEQL